MSKKRFGSLLATAGLGVGLLVGPLALNAGAQPRAASGFTDHCVHIPLTGGLEITLCAPTPTVT